MRTNFEFRAVIKDGKPILEQRKIMFGDIGCYETEWQQVENPTTIRIDGKIVNHCPLI